MSEKKAEKDFSELVDGSIPKLVEQAKKDVTSLSASLEELAALEKKARLASDGPSVVKVAKAVVSLLADLGEWKQLNDQITALCKKRSQLQSVITAVIRDGIALLPKTPNKEIWLELLDALRLQAAGKMYVELERARMTKMLAEYQESLGKTVEAADTLQEIQVETVGSMELQEKAEFLLEQLRLCLAKRDWVRAEIVINKVDRKRLEEEPYQSHKLKFYELVAQYHGHYNNYFEMCKAFNKIYHTKAVQQDEQQWRRALTKSVIFLALSPYDYEVSELTSQYLADPKLDKTPTLKKVLTQLSEDELIRWPVQFEAEWKADDAFSSAADPEQRWKDLHKRIVQHNIRIIGKMYSNIRTTRLAEMLQLDEQGAEDHLSEMVTSKQLFARMDRHAGTITFVQKQDPNAVLNSWSSDLSELLSLVEKTCHMITKEQMLHGLA